MKTADIPRSVQKTQTPEKPATVTNKLLLTSILVPTDFSETSLKALAYAEALAEQFDARITLLHIVEPIAMPDFAGAYPLAFSMDELTASAKKNLDQLATQNSINPARIDRVLIRQGRAYHEIIEAARALGSDAIVISTHGYSGLSRAILGSVTERVVRHAPCPVLVVREKEHDFLKT